MNMKKGLLMAALAGALMDGSSIVPQQTRRASVRHKDPLNKKQKKVRAKNKRQRASRKANRK